MFTCKCILQKCYSYRCDKTKQELNSKWILAMCFQFHIKISQNTNYVQIKFLTRYALYVRKLIQNVTKNKLRILYKTYLKKTVRTIT